MQYFPYSLWFISLSIMPLRFIQIVTNGRIPFSQSQIIFLRVCVCACARVSVWHFIHSSVGRLLVSLHLLTVVTNTTVNIWMQTSLWDPHLSSFGYISKSEILGSHGSSIFNVLKILHTPFSVAASVLFSPTVHRVPFSGYPVHHLIISCLFVVHN